MASSDPQDPNPPSGPRVRAVPAVTRAVAILRLLGRSPSPLTLKTISQELGMVTSTCLHSLRVLVEEGLVKVDTSTKRYSLGVGMLALARSVIETSAFPALVQPVLDRLADTWNVTVTSVPSTVDPSAGPEISRLGDCAEPIPTEPKSNPATMTIVPSRRIVPSIADDRSAPANRAVHDPAKAIEHGRTELAANEMDANDAVFIYDGRITLPKGKIDAIILEMRCYGFPSAEAVIAVPYTPRSKGGLTTWENVVCSCVPCNLRKGGRTPEEAGMRLLRRPVRPRWTPAFRTPSRFYEDWRPFLSAADLAYWNTELLPG